MARIRTIKPEFWVDDQIVELDFVTRLLFIGLWNFVDDEGYIEYKPKRIKMQVFPADEIDVSGNLRSLLESSRIEEYDSDQGHLLKVTNWERHQKVSHAAPTRFSGIRAVSPEPSRRLLIPPEPSALNGIEGNRTEGNRDVPEDRPDVSRLCEMLADLIEGNGSKRPTIVKGWTTSARLLLDTDKRPLAEAVALMQWCQADAFWKANIMSMPKFREKYDTVRLQRESKTGKATTKVPAKDEWMYR